MAVKHPVEENVNTAARRRNVPEIDTEPSVSTRRGAAAPEVRSLLVVLADGVWEKDCKGDWKGRAGLTDRSVYVALLRVANRHGTLIPVGVRVSVAVRQLALEAAVSTTTVTASTRRLTLEHGLIRRDGHGEGPKCGAFVLLVDPRSTYTLAQGYHRREAVSSELPECISSARVAFRWGAGRLGKTKEFILDALRRLGECTEGELAVTMGREGRTRELRPHLKDLVVSGFIRRRGERYAIDKDIGWHLELERACNGELEAEDHYRQRYKDESERFKEDWEAGRVGKRREQSATKPQG